MPGSIIRALRVFGLFGRAKSLQYIIQPLHLSLIPVINAFAIMGMLISFYSIMGVALFHHISPYMFGSFIRGFITMFWAVAGETWLRDPMTGDLPKVPSEDSNVSPVPVLFLFSFMLIVNWVLLQVTVAVLLDNFIQVSSLEEKQEWVATISERQNLHNIQNPLDPLLKWLIMGYVNDAYLLTKLEVPFRKLDESDNGCLLWDEICAALKRLNTTPRIHMAKSDFNVITQNHKLCYANGNISISKFCYNMMQQIQYYTHKQLY